ncbi:MAG: YraN family protein [Rickettsiales bacterium]|jgi:putative endonuclease|nr:YraN family protein [Rickettsiales bacterium]
MSNNYQDGLEAENLAADELARRGFKIVERRYAAVRGTTAGEIDIVALKGRILVFVEVKKRASLPLAAESITTVQRARIARNAEAFLAKHDEFSGFDCRFDAILLDGEHNMEYIENAW